MTDSTVESLSQFLDVDVARYRLVANNLANIDTPGYPTRDIDFRAELERAAFTGWANGNAVNEPGNGLYVAFAPVARRVRGLLERPDGNNVSLERETLLLAETQMRYNLGIQLVKDEFHTLSSAINSGGTSS